MKENKYALRSPGRRDHIRWGIAFNLCHSFTPYYVYRRSRVVPEYTSHSDERKKRVVKSCIKNSDSSGASYIKKVKTQEYRHAVGKFRSVIMKTTVEYKIRCNSVAEEKSH